MLRMQRELATVSKADQDMFAVNLPSCQLKLLIIRNLLPTRQLIASKVSKINVMLTPMMAGFRLSDMASDGTKYQEVDDHETQPLARRLVFICAFADLVNRMAFDVPVRPCLSRHGLRVEAWLPRVGAAVTYRTARECEGSV